MTNEGDYISWYDFTCEIYRQAGMDTKVIPVTTEEYGPTIAVRPFNLRLDMSKLSCEGFEPIPTWQDVVARYLREADIYQFADCVLQTLHEYEKRGGRRTC